MNRYYTSMTIIALAATTLVAFQNCGEAFELPPEATSVSLNSSGTASQLPALNELSQSSIDSGSTSPNPISTTSAASAPSAPSAVTPSATSPLNQSTNPPQAVPVNVAPQYYPSPSLACSDDLWTVAMANLFVAGTSALFIQANLGVTENNIVAVTWSQESGPNSVQIISPSNSATRLMGVTYGTYKFRITVEYLEFRNAQSTRSISCDKYLVLPQTEQDRILIYNNLLRSRI